MVIVIKRMLWSEMNLPILSLCHLNILHNGDAEEYKTEDVTLKFPVLFYQPPHALM